LAVEKGHILVVKYLLQNAADLAATNNNTKKAIDLVVGDQLRRIFEGIHPFQ